MNRRSILVGSLGLCAAAAPMPSPTALRAAEVGGRRRTRPARRAPTDPVTAADGTRLFHYEFGTGAQPLLFTASWALDSRMWDHQVAHFASRGYHCIAWDRRGHGRSDLAAAGYDMDRLADDLAAVIEQRNLCDVTLVGHSMGAAEIIHYLARHGSRRVRRVVLLAPVAPFVLQTPDNPFGAPLAFHQRVWAQMATDFPAWVEANQAAFFTPDVSPPLRDVLTRQLLAVSLPVALAAHRALVTTDLRSDLPKIDVPVLILHGDRDASAPVEITGRRLAAALPHAELKIYPGAPHGLWITHLAQVNDDLERFARR